MVTRKFQLFRETFPKFPTYLLFRFYRHLLADCETVLDIGCGENSPLRFLPAQTTGIDAYAPSIKQAKKRHTHDKLEVLNLTELTKRFPNHSFDAVVALDVIEHLPKKDGEQFLKIMERLARKKVVVFTPNGFIEQTGPSEFDTHRSGWTPQDFEKQGYKVYGMLGPKQFRGSYHKLLHRPELFWAAVSEINQWTYTYSHPNTAAALLGVKEIYARKLV